MPGQIDQLREYGGGAVCTVNIRREPNVRMALPAVALEGERKLDARHLRYGYLAGTRSEVRRLVELYIRDTGVGELVCHISQDFVATLEGANVPSEDEDVS